MPWISDEEAAELERLKEQADQKPGDFDLTWNALTTGDEPREVLVARQRAAEAQAKVAPNSWERNHALQASIFWAARQSDLNRQAEDARGAQRLDGLLGGAGRQLADPKPGSEEGQPEPQPQQQPPQPPPASVLDYQIAEAKEAGNWSEAIRLAAQKHTEQLMGQKR